MVKGRCLLPWRQQQLVKALVKKKVPVLLVRVMRIVRVVRVVRVMKVLYWRKPKLKESQDRAPMGKLLNITTCTHVTDKASHLTAFFCTRLLAIFELPCFQ